MKKRGRLIFCLIVCLFALPFALASFLFFSGWSPAGYTNVGTLLTPPPHLPNVMVEAYEEKQTFPLYGNWWLVSVMPAHCEAVCQAGLHQMRQIHTALGKDAVHVKRLWITDYFYPIEIPEKEKNALFTFKNDRTFISQYFPNSEKGPAFFIVDPNGFVILQYTETDLGKGVLKDLTRLLKYAPKGKE